jgi:outer membrane lipopolysaccharide assembly protein LptE/RlpB
MRKLIAVPLVVLAVGCGYHLVGRSGNLPAQLQKLFIAPFVNQTGRAELDQRLTEEVTQEWVRRGRFQLVSSAGEADAVLSGTITSAGVSPVRFDEQGRATEYQLSVSADCQLVDRTGIKPVVLWRDQQFTRQVSYEVSASAVDYFDREVQAIESVSRDFARGLVVTILEGF